MQIAVSSRKALIVLLFMIGFLVLANIAGIVAAFASDAPSVRGSIRLFDLDTEGNLPTQYSALQLLGAGVLFWLIGRAHKFEGSADGLWTVLAVIFLFLAFDEANQVHERFIRPVRAMLDTHGLLYWPWVIPYASAFTVLGLAFSRFLARLPRHTARLFLVAAAIYVSGAIGFDMLGGRWIESNETRNIVYSMLYTVEETLEMLGIALLIYAQLDYLSEHFGAFRIAFRR